MPETIIVFLADYRSHDRTRNASRRDILTSEIPVHPGSFIGAQYACERCYFPQVTPVETGVENCRNDLVDRARQDAAPFIEQAVCIWMPVPHERQVPPGMFQDYMGFLDKPVRNGAVEIETPAVFPGHDGDEGHHRFQANSPSNARQRLQGRALPAGLVGGNRGLGGSGDPGKFGLGQTGFSTVFADSIHEFIISVWIYFVQMGGKERREEPPSSNR
jgi:hypothetical protein